MIAAHQLGGVGQYAQRTDPEQVELGQAEGLDVHVIELGDAQSRTRTDR